LRVVPFVDTTECIVTFGFECWGATLPGQSVNIVEDGSFAEGIRLVRMVLEAVAAVKAADCEDVGELQLSGELEVVESGDAL
jgi:hypothetical protein